MAAAPPRFGRWRVLRPIGAGAHATVHLAIDDGGRVAVALKTLPLDDDDARERFAAEAQAVRRLEHPDIVAVLDSGQTAHVGWLAMELLGGCDLRRYARPARLLPEPLVLEIGERLARALAHAHGRGVVHRDVKPSNVVVDWARGRVTLTDFGLARLDDAARTKSGVVPGSPEYMAPELLAGAPADARSDVYALGVLLYELLAGRRPHEAPTLGALLHRVATQPAPPLDALRPGLPPALAALVGQALQRRAADRPDGALALAGELAALRQSLPAELLRADAVGGPAAAPG